MKPWQPGFIWLCGQEIRILWRGSRLLRSRRYVLVPVVLVAVIFQGAAWLAAAAIVRHLPALPEMLLAANINLIFCFCLMLSRAISTAVDVLYARGDVDFLLASPVPPGQVLAVRMLGVALAVASPWLLLGGTLANGLTVFGQPWALAIYPMLLALALLASALAFVFIMLLVGRMGPGRARALGHAMSLTVGLVIFGLGQAPRFVPPESMARLWHAFMPAPSNHASLKWLPGRAMLGQPLPLLACLAAALAVFGLVWAMQARQFATGAIIAAAHRPGVNSQRPSSFRAKPFAAVFIKNLRLLLRFPGLLTQTVYRSLTLVPVVMILAGSVQIGTGPQVVAPLLVFLAGQLGLFFISVMAGSDQSPELAASAPAPAPLVQQAALSAAAYATMLIMALPVFGVAWREPAILPVMLAAMAGALLSNLALGTSFPIPLTRAAFGKPQTGSIFGLALGVGCSSFWALAAWLWVTPHPLSWLA